MMTNLSMSYRVIIAGGGIGGLTAAIALQKAGFEAQVFERASELREVGAGISLWANAVNALDAIGVGAEIRARGLAGVQAGLRTSSGRMLSAASYDDLARRFGAAIILVHRADLLGILSAHVPAERIHLGFECTGFEQSAEGVRVRFANGETAMGDVLVGADGLRSRVRAQMFGDAAPRYSGYVAWRSVVRVEGQRLVFGESWGCGQRFGIVPLADGRIYWFATKNCPEDEQEAPEGRKQHLLKLFAHWHDPIPALIEAAEESAILRTNLYDREPLSRWTEGRVTLLGDAAHPMTPNLGQGGGQAIEDAVVLAVCLKGAQSVEAGLQTYEQRRIPRTSSILLESRRLGDVGQWENPLKCWIRDLGMRMVPDSMAQGRLNRVAGFDPLTKPEREIFKG